MLLFAVGKEKIQKKYQWRIWNHEEKMELCGNSEGDGDSAVCKNATKRNNERCLTTSCLKN